MPVGTEACGKVDLGTSTAPHNDKVQGKVRWLLTRTRCVQQWKRSEPAGWLECGVREPGQDRSRKWKAESHGLSSGRLSPIRKVPSDLFSWGKVESPTFHLCSWRGTLEHILSWYPKAPVDGP